MSWRWGLLVVFGLCIVGAGACDGRLLPGGFPSSTAGSGGSADQATSTSQNGAGGAMTAVVVTPPAGAGGSGVGGSGVGGSSGAGGALTCDDLVALYAAAVEQDKACDPNSTEPQCQLHVIPALCVGCRATTFVSSTAASSAARLRWDNVPCPVTPCAQECSPLPTAGRCAPTSDGGGHCVDIVP